MKQTIYIDDNDGLKVLDEWAHVMPASRKSGKMKLTKGIEISRCRARNGIVHKHNPKAGGVVKTVSTKGVRVLDNGKEEYQRAKERAMHHSYYMSLKQNERMCG